MGNEISAAGGAVATGVTGTAAVLTLGQSKAVNKAVQECATYTAHKASDSMVCNSLKAVGAGGVALGSGAVSFVSGSDRAQEVFEDMGEVAAEAGRNVADQAAKTVWDTLEATPFIGHILAALEKQMGNKEKARRINFVANRSTSVLSGAVLGTVVGGPIGGILGAIAGGGSADAVQTGYASWQDGKYSPQGQMAAWTHVAKAENGQQVVDGIVSGLAAPLFDGIVGYGIESQLSAPLEEEVLFSRGAVRQPGSSNPNPTLLNESASDFVVLPTQVSVNELAVAAPHIQGQDFEEIPLQESESDIDSEAYTE